MMAWADYKICDCCGDRKVFYDADIQDERYRATFGEKSDYDPIGLKAICGDCNKTHEVVIVSRDAADRIEALIAERDAARDAALEEAAKVAEGMRSGNFRERYAVEYGRKMYQPFRVEAACNDAININAEDTAAAIRALKGKSQ